MKVLPKRDEVKASDKWDLAAIYRDLDEFRTDYDKVTELIGQFPALKGTIQDAESYLRYAALEEEAGRLMGKVYVYGTLLYNQDMTDQTNQNLQQQGQALFTRFTTATAFAEPEILALPDDLFDGIINDESVAQYRFHLEKMRNIRDHVLTRDQEEVLATFGEVRQGSQNTYGIFTNAELAFPTVKDEKGEEHLLTQGSYNQLLKSKDRTLRKNAFETLHETYGKTENTLGFLLVTSMKDYVAEARLRGYASSVEQALKPNSIPTSVFYNAIDTINEHLVLLHRYVALKKKFLKLDEIHMYDLYVPLGNAGSERYSFDEGVAMALEALKPMGNDYIETFRRGLTEGWMDRYENEGKRSGAYSSGVYDTLPYISLNFDGTLSDVSTMVHEMGHSIHSWYTRKNQPFIYGNYSIFLAEVASTCSEKLLIHDLIAKETDRDRRIALINQELEQIRTTMFRQLMFAEFEKITHEKLEAGEQISAGDLDAIWLDLNRKFFGADIIIDEAIKFEWSRIPHFYRDFYVYQYATGYAMASSFARQILTEGETAAERYIERFLKAGSSKYPVDVMKDAGVDITTPKPMEDAMKDFAELMDLLEKEYEAE